MGIAVTAIAFTAYPCNDVAGTRAWYERTLGLRFAGPYVEDGIEKYNESHIGDGCFSLMSAEWFDGAKGTGIVFEVASVDEALASLRAAGVEIFEEFEGPVCKQVTVRDPEGNRLTLHESTRK